MANQTVALVLIGGRGSKLDYTAPRFDEARALGPLLGAVETIKLHPNNGINWEDGGGQKSYRNWKWVAVVEIGETSIESGRFPLRVYLKTCECRCR